MGSEWKETTVGEFCHFTYGKSLPARKRNESGGIPVYGSGGLGGYHDEPMVNDAGIIIGRKGTVGSITYSSHPFWPIDTVFYVTNDSHRDLKFTYYLLKTLGLEHMNADSAVPGLNRDAAHGVVFRAPPLPEQKAIAHILGTLDDKIELNRRMNATLEGMAQALFKSWFVDFDPVIDNALAAGNHIPNELAPRAEVRKKALANGTAQQGSVDHPTLSDHNSLFPAGFEYSDELGPIPQGWEVKQLDELIKLIGGGTPKTSVEEYWNGDIPWFSVVDAPNDSDVFVIDTEKMITEEGLNNSSTKLLRPGTTIISARGTVGRCALVGVEMTMNQSCYGIQGADGASDSYTYYSIRHYVSDLQQRGHGSVFNTITRDTFRSIKVPFGSAELTAAFENQVTDLLSRIKGNLQGQTTLTKLRDTLLPRLISGELRIPPAERLTNEIPI